MHASRRIILTGMASSLLAACGSILPNSGPAPDVYTLTPKNTFRTDLPSVSWQLVVEEPVSAGGLDNNRVVIQPTPYEVKYLADARWSERTPKMIQTLLVESFENSGKILSVARQSVGLRSDYNLKSELREFQVEMPTGQSSPLVRVKLNVKIVRQPKQEIVASRNFEESIPARSVAMKDLVVAFDDALGKVLRRTVEWTIALGKE